VRGRWFERLALHPDSSRQRGDSVLRDGSIALYTNPKRQRVLLVKCLEELSLARRVSVKVAAVHRHAAFRRAAVPSSTASK
jgi:hypothetical protein